MSAKDPPMCVPYIANFEGCRLVWIQSKPARVSCTGVGYLYVSGWGFVSVGPRVWSGVSFCPCGLEIDEGGDVGCLVSPRR